MLTPKFLTRKHQIFRQNNCLLYHGLAKVVIRYPTGLSRERQHLRELSEAISHLSLKSTLFYVLYSWNAQSQQEPHILSLLCRLVRILVPRVKSTDAGLPTPKGMVLQSTPYSMRTNKLFYTICS